jgi:hypothetical protein
VGSAGLSTGLSNGYVQFSSIGPDPASPVRPAEFTTQRVSGCFLAISMTAWRTLVT